MLWRCCLLRLTTQGDYIHIAISADTERRPPQREPA